MASLQPGLKCRSCLMYGWLSSVVEAWEGTIAVGIQSYLLSAHSLLTHRITYPLLKGLLTVCSESYLLRVQRITYPACKGLLTVCSKSYLLKTLTICLEVYLPLVQIVTYCYLKRVTYYSFKGLLTWVSYIQAQPALKTYTYAAIPALS